MTFKRYLNEDQLKGFERYKVKMTTKLQAFKFLIYSKRSSRLMTLIVHYSLLFLHSYAITRSKVTRITFSKCVKKK